jgi:hypothetical protein
MMYNQNLTTTWGVDLETAICEHCDWSYLLPAGLLPVYCPHCFHTLLTSLTGQVDDLLYSQPPELILPFTVSTEKLAQNIQTFARGIWFAPGDLNPQNLKERLQRIYLPMWLVDSDVQATWQGEAGFNYEVVSHRDQFVEKRGGWVSQQVTETRIRWEPRLGRLTRTYYNAVAPALEEHAQLQGKLGPSDLKAARPYHAQALTDAFPSIRETAIEECRRASSADHFRQFRWKATYPNLNWTLLLLPVYVTYYLDDKKNPQPILIHGQTGQLSGPRRASMKQAQRTALIIVGVAIAIFILSLMMAIVSISVQRLFPAAVIGLIVALIIGLLALIPIVIAWQFNRTHQSETEN